MFGEDLDGTEARRRARDEQRERADRLYAGDWLSGRLLRHGRAPYHFNRENPESYYLLLQTPYGRQPLWGQDLERAIKESRSKPKVGDAISARITFRESLPNDRTFNHWEVEKSMYIVQARRVAREILEDPVTARRAGKEGATVTGSYLLIRGAEMLAQIQYTDEPSRKAFVAKVRAAAGMQPRPFENLTPDSRDPDQSERASQGSSDNPPRREGFARE